MFSYRDNNKFRYNSFLPKEHCFPIQTNQEMYGNDAISSRIVQILHKVTLTKTCISLPPAEER